MDHQCRRTRLARRTCERNRIVHAAAHTGEHGHPSGDYFGDLGSHTLCFGKRQAIEFTRIAIDRQDMDTGVYRPIDDRDQTLGR